jgi:rhodanese-related sulfurtransferase
MGYTMTIYVDGEIRTVWSCRTKGSLAECRRPYSQMAAKLEKKGIDLRPANSSLARRLMKEWDLSGEPPKAGIYYPKDGIQFLLALWATYCRGSRMWAEPAREECPPWEQQIEYRIADRQTMEAGYLVNEPYAVISIRDPERRKPKIHQPGHCKGVLYLAFDDAEPSEAMILPGQIRLMTAEDAAAIWAFHEEHRQHVRTMVIHCEQGVSRSPAVAAALTSATGGDPSLFFRDYQPNGFIYRRLLETAISPESVLH